MTPPHGDPPATFGERAARAYWLGMWRLRARYHRYEVEDFERLAAPGAALLVGYHGRPLAYDLCMLSVVMHDRLGYLPHGILHGAFGTLPGLRTLQRGLGFVTSDGPELAEAVARGEHILVTPGGTREGCRSLRHRYEVDWGERYGYLRLALKYRLPILPIAGQGVDDTYLGFNNGYRLGELLHAPSRLPVWIGLGPLGPWPLSPPFPVKLRDYVGAPIDLTAEGPVDPGDRTRLAVLHHRVIAAVQALLDRANRR